MLEKMHISKFFRLLIQHPDLDFFQAILDPGLRQRSRKQFVGLIMATDMSKHFAALGSFQTQISEHPESLTTTRKDVALPPLS